MKPGNFNIFKTKTAEVAYGSIGSNLQSLSVKYLKVVSREMLNDEQVSRISFPLYSPLQNNKKAKK